MEPVTTSILLGFLLKGTVAGKIYSGFKLILTGKKIVGIASVGKGMLAHHATGEALNAFSDLPDDYDQWSEIIDQQTAAHEAFLRESIRNHDFLISNGHDTFTINPAYLDTGLDGQWELEFFGMDPGLNAKFVLPDVQDWSNDFHSDIWKYDFPSEDLFFDTNNSITSLGGEFDLTSDDSINNHTTNIESYRLPEPENSAQVFFGRSVQYEPFIADSQGNNPFCGFEAIENAIQARIPSATNDISDWLVDLYRQQGLNPHEGLRMDFYQNILDGFNIPSEWIPNTIGESELAKILQGEGNSIVLTGTPYFMDQPDLYPTLTPASTHAVVLTDATPDASGHHYLFKCVDSNRPGQTTLLTIEQIRKINDFAPLGSFTGKLLIIH